jgi:hypothetical protein
MVLISLSVRFHDILTDTQAQRPAQNSCYPPFVQLQRVVVYDCSVEVLENYDSPVGRDRGFRLLTADVVPSRRGFLGSR